MKKESVISSIAVLLLVLPVHLLAQSFYSQRGIGLVRHFVSGPAAGMGGTGLAVSNLFAVDFLNPASLSAMPITAISANFLHESTDLKGNSQDASFTDTNFSGVQFVVPLKTQRIALGLGLAPFSNIEYSFEASRVENDVAFDETISGDGGVNTAFVSLSISPFKKLMLGATGDFYFGVLKNFREVSHIDPGLLDSFDEVSRQFSSLNYRLGFIYKMLDFWSIGGVYSPSLALNPNKSIKILTSIVSNVGLLQTETFSDLPDDDILIPRALGIGTAFTLRSRWLIALDYYTQEWSKSGRDGLSNDSRRISFGLERMPNTRFNSPYFSRVAYRLGFYFNDLGIEDPVGERITESFLTFGLGLPIKWSAGRIDLALQVGKRGNAAENPFQENVVRFRTTITIGERWFFRGGVR